MAEIWSAVNPMSLRQFFLLLVLYDVNKGVILDLQL